MQKYWNVSDISCNPLSEINVSGRSYWLNSHLRTVIIEQVSVFYIGKISGHLEWASTTTEKLRPMITPTKSTCTWDHGCSGLLGRKTGAADDLSVGVTLAWVQHPRSLWKKKRLMISLVCFVIALWAGDLETALQTVLRGMSRKTHWLDKIKTQSVVSRISSVDLSVCCFVLIFDCCWQLFSDLDTI